MTRSCVVLVCVRRCRPTGKIRVSRFRIYHMTVHVIAWTSSWSHWVSVQYVQYVQRSLTYTVHWRTMSYMYNNAATSKKKCKKSSESALSKKLNKQVSYYFTDWILPYLKKSCEKGWMCHGHTGYEHAGSPCFTRGSRRISIDAPSRQRFQPVLWAIILNFRWIISTSESF